MKVVNSRGRVLLEVTKAETIPATGETFYSYSGDSCGGYGPRSQLDQMIATIKSDAPSAKVIGTLPCPSPSI